MKPTHRTLWMIPRNIRRIEAWKMVQIVQLLDACTGNTTDQDVQDALYAQLANLDIKVKANPYGVANSGGMRTYFAQLTCLGLFWKDEKGNFSTTFAGDELMNSAGPLKVLRCQLLRMQYPSAYGSGPNVRVSPELAVRPFVFLINLWKDERLRGYLTEEEMAVAVTYGRTHRHHERCVEKILKMRSGASLADVIDSVDDLRTPKRCTEADPERDFRLGITDIVEIANTAKNYLIATQLVLEADEERTADETGAAGRPIAGRRDKRFVLNDDAEIQKEILQWADERIEPFDPQRSEAWQQRYGRYTKTKSIRSRTEKKRDDGIRALVSTNFISAVMSSPYGIDLGEFIRDEARRWGKSEAEIGRYLSGVRTRRNAMERDAMRKAAASGGKDAIVLEKGITAIFRKLGFELSEHLGQRKAPREGGYPDLRIRSARFSQCGFGDAKATMKYDIPIGDRTKLGTYYKECWQEFPDRTPSTFFLYIAGGFGKSDAAIRRSLASCSESYGRPVSALTVDALLDLAELSSGDSVSETERLPKPEQLVAAFCAGGLYTTGETLLRSVP